MKKSQFEQLVREVIRETIRKVDGKYVVYPEKGGKRLGTHSTKKAAEKQLTAIHLNKEAVEPNFNFEWGEATRYPEFKKLGKKKWIELAKTGKAITITSAKDINNTDANEPNAFKTLNPDKQKRALAQLKSGNVEMPIVAIYPDGYKELVAGNTRLTAMMSKNGKATIWQFKVPKDILDENFSDGKEKEIVDDILSGLNESTLSGVLDKMKHYAKKGLLTLGIVASVAQGLQAQGLPQNDINTINQQGIELVQQTKSVDRNTERILIQTLGQEKFDALVKLAKENNLLLGASKSKSLNIAKSSSRLNALSGINGEVTTQIVDSKTYKTSDGQFLVIQFLKVTLKETVSNRIKHYQQKPPVDWEKRDWELYDENITDTDTKLTVLSVIDGKRNLDNDQISQLFDDNTGGTFYIYTNEEGEYEDTKPVSRKDALKYVDYYNARLQKDYSKEEKLGAELGVLGIESELQFKQGEFKTDPTIFSPNENYADGKVKGKSRPGRVKKAGASCKGSVTDLRAKAKKYGGEKGKMYHWCANMKGGKK